jgi:hypothetical protein
MGYVRIAAYLMHDLILRPRLLAALYSRSIKKSSQVSTVGVCSAPGTDQCVKTKLCHEPRTMK